MEKITPYVHWRTILFGDTDAAAVVYTPKFTDYCMEAAEVWFRDYVGIDWFQNCTELGQGTPVVHMELDFTAGLIGNDNLGVVVRVGKLGRSTVTLEFEGIRIRGEDDDPTDCFTAKFTFCFISAKNRTSLTIPDNQRELIEAYCSGCEAEPILNMDS